MSKEKELQEEAEAKAEKFRLAKIEASKRLIERKKQALAVLIALAEKSGSPEEKEAGRYLSGGRKLGLVSFTPEDIFGKEKSIHEDLLFKHKKLGRAEMKKIIKKAEKAGVKITFDIQTGIYAIA